MSITRIALNHFMALSRINGRLCIGYGKTTTEALQSAFKDYQVILSLKSN